MNREPIVIHTDGRSDELVPCANAACDTRLVSGWSLGGGLCTACYFDAELIRIINADTPEDDCS